MKRANPVTFRYLPDFPKSFEDFLSIFDLLLFVDALHYKSTHVNPRRAQWIISRGRISSSFLTLVENIRKNDLVGRLLTQ